MGKIIIVVFIILILGMITLLIYTYLPLNNNQNEDKKYTEGATDEIACGSLSAEEQTACCKARHKLEESEYPCKKGEWYYVARLDSSCIFSCSESNQKDCGTDVKHCPDGTFRIRDPALNCEFKDCLNQCNTPTRSC